MEISDWIALGELIVAIIGIIVGCIGGKELKEANELKIQFRDLETKIEKLEFNNSQFAKVINNNGIGIKEADYIANKVADEKAKSKSSIYYTHYIHTCQY